MEIIKHGKYHNKKETFECCVCGCIYKLSYDEYKDTRQKVSWSQEYFYQTFCPECGANVIFQPQREYNVEK